MKTILVRPFDEVAAIELAAHRSGRPDANTANEVVLASPWAKLRFDRQIVAIAKTNGAKRIYSDDEDVTKFATRIGIEVMHTWELPLPGS